MATVRAPLGALQRITIGVNEEPNLPGLSIGPSDSVEFYNASPNAISVQFKCANGPVFNDIASLNPYATSSPQTPQKTEITTDYVVTNLTTHASTGPFSIEIGINVQTVPAPLLVVVTANAPQPNNGTVAVPINGWIQFDLSDGAYVINWTPTGVFPSGTYGPGLITAWQASTGNQAQAATFSLSGPRGVVGGGTVKVGS
jgi:hypothetical protein